MSAIILPSRSLLKPDRAWDLPGPSRPRARSAWWRHLLGGRNGLTRLQPGACCGCTSLFACSSCGVPAQNLTLSWSGNGGWPAGSATMVYKPGFFGQASWDTGCLSPVNTITNNAQCVDYVLVCNSGPPTIQSQNYGVSIGPSCSCAGTPSGTNPTFTSLTCGTGFTATFTDYWGNYTISK